MRQKMEAPAGGGTAWKYGICRVGEGRDTRVGFMWSLWIVHKRPRGPWIATHRPSGMAIPLHFKRRKLAQLLCEAINALEDWSTITALNAAERLANADEAAIAAACRRAGLNVSVRFHCIDGGRA